MRRILFICCFVMTAIALMDIAENVWGYCYTQLTDVEQEQNGIYFYDRSSKFDMERIRAIFSKRPQSSKE